MKRRTRLVVFAILVAAVSGAPAAADESMSATVRLNVRGGPGLDRPVLDTLFKGERVLVTQCRGEWCQITHVGIDGWVYAPYLAAATFTRTWRATSAGLPATLADDTAANPDLGVTVDLSRPRRCPANRPFC